MSWGFFSPMISELWLRPKVERKCGRESKSNFWQYSLWTQPLLWGPLWKGLERAPHHHDTASSINRVEWLEERRPDFGERFPFGQDWDRHGKDEFKQDLLQQETVQSGVPHVPFQSTQKCTHKREHTESFLQLFESQSVLSRKQPED